MIKAIQIAEVYIKLRNQLNGYTTNGGVSTEMFSELLDVKADLHRILLTEMRESLNSTESLEILNLINDKIDR